MKTSFLTSMIFAGLLMAGPAFAQEAAPSDALLQTPASALPAAAPQPQAYQNTGGGTPSGDPCPAPQGALADTPDDLAKVQEEIDRFSLCVQRAQLLERLNESAMKNQETNDRALGYMPMPAGLPGIPGAQGPAGLAPLPAAALAGADVSPAAAATAASEAADAAAAAAEVAETVAKEEEEKKSAVWTIREIFGSGSEMQARLVSPEGDEVKAHNGMKLPDGKTVVVRITPAGVTVRDSSGAKTLQWAKS